MQLAGSSSSKFAMRVSVEIIERAFQIRKRWSIGTSQAM